MIEFIFHSQKVLCNPSTTEMFVYIVHSFKFGIADTISNFKWICLFVKNRHITNSIIWLTVGLFHHFTWLFICFETRLKLYIYGSSSAMVKLIIKRIDHEFRLPLSSKAYPIIYGSIIIIYGENFFDKAGDLFLSLVINVQSSPSLIGSAQKSFNNMPRLQVHIICFKWFENV